MSALHLPSPTLLKSKHLPDTRKWVCQTVDCGKWRADSSWIMKRENASWAFIKDDSWSQSPPLPWMYFVNWSSQQPKEGAHCSPLATGELGALLIGLVLVSVALLWLPWCGRAGRGAGSLWSSSWDELWDFLQKNECNKQCVLRELTSEEQMGKDTQHTRVCGGSLHHPSCSRTPGCIEDNVVTWPWKATEALWIATSLSKKQGSFHTVLNLRYHWHLKIHAPFLLPEKKTGTTN